MKLCFILSGAALALLSPVARGQSIWPSTINSAGGTATLSGNNYEYSVGEMVLVNTFVTPTIIVTQGVLQPETLSASSVPGKELVNNLQVFPNPANNLVNVQYTAQASGAMTLRLMDITGKLIKEDRADLKQGVNSRQVDVASLAAATYMLQVSINIPGQPEELISYKIQKLQ